MEDFVLILLIVAVVWLAIRQRTLGRELGQLRDLYLRLNRTDSPQQPAPPQSSPAPRAPYAGAPPDTAAPHRPAFTPPPAPTPHVPLPTPPVAAAPPKPRVSLEERLGQNWLNKLGIVILVIGLALFLGYQLRTLGPLGKSLIGFALAAAILGGGLFLERKPNYRLFARTCIGGGWALLFFLSFCLLYTSRCV